MKDDWITTAAGAELSGYTLRHVRELVTSGAVKGQRFGNVWQVSRQSLQKYAAQAAKLGAKRGPKPGV
jgi:hypothetical protein